MLQNGALERNLLKPRRIHRKPTGYGHMIKSADCQNPVIRATSLETALKLGESSPVEGPREN